MKYQLSFVFCCLFLVAQAQESMKGLWRVGQGNAKGTWTYSIETPATQLFSIAPSFAKFTGHKTLLGVDATLSTFRIADSFGSSVFDNRHSLSPFIRKYFTNGALKPFVGARITYYGGFIFRNFEVSLGPGLAYFPNNQMSIDLAIDLDLTYSRNRSVTIIGSTPVTSVIISTERGWNRKPIPSLRLSTNIYLPFANKEFRKVINPFDYQKRGNRIFSLSGSMIQRNFYNQFTTYLEIETHSSLSLSYQRFLSDQLVVQGNITSRFSNKVLSINDIELSATRYFKLPNPMFQLFATWQSTYNRGAIYNPNTQMGNPTYELNNGLTIGAQYAMANNLFSIYFGNVLQSSTAKGFDTWGNKVVGKIGANYECFLAKKASIMVFANLVPHSRYMSIETENLAFIPQLTWHLGCGYRVYFVN